jgi:hypothetical protein
MLRPLDRYTCRHVGCKYNRGPGAWCTPKRAKWDSSLMCLWPASDPPCHLSSRSAGCWLTHPKGEHIRLESCPVPLQNLGGQPARVCGLDAAERVQVVFFRQVEVGHLDAPVGIHQPARRREQANVGNNMHMWQGSAVQRMRERETAGLIAQVTPRASLHGSSRVHETVPALEPAWARRQCGASSLVPYARRGNQQALWDIFYWAGRTIANQSLTSLVS